MSSRDALPVLGDPIERNDPAASAPRPINMAFTTDNTSTSLSAAHSHASSSEPSTLRTSGSVGHDGADRSQRRAKEGDASDAQSSYGSQSEVSDRSAADDGVGVKEELFLTKQLKEQHSLREARGLPRYRHPLALAFKNFSVRGEGGSGVTFAPTVGSTFNPASSFGDKRRMKELEKAKGLDGDAEKGVISDKPIQGGEGKSTLKKGEKFLIHDFSGVVKPHEMLLVVGRPGSGCSTFLKSICGLTSGYAGTDGELYYGSMKASEAKKLRPYSAAIVFNAEDDVHFPNLSVKNTLEFAFRNKVPASAARPAASQESNEPISEEEYEHNEKARLLKVFGLEHTINTKVGDEYVRGVSGGEKKRVSVVEMLSNRASIQAWDNATRGLDANTALEFAKSLRAYSDLEGLVAAVSLYQAGNGIYNQFDKVLVIAEAQVIYFGPRTEAQGYMESIGFECLNGANVADFLTGVTSSHERRIRKDFEGKAPVTVAEFAAAYRKSDICERMEAELDEHLANMDALEAATKRTQEDIQREKHSSAIKREPHTKGIAAQTMIALKREVQQRWGDKWTFWCRQATTLVQGLVLGSLYYMMPLSTNAIFTRGGAIYLSLVFPSLISLSETTAAFSGRAVLAKHKAFSLYRPTAVFLAQTIVDLPIFLVQLVIFTLIIYFMGGFQTHPGSYFIFLLFIFMTTLCTTALFRLIGSCFPTFQAASKVSGFLFSVLVTMAGYVIPVPSMKPWFAWLRWVDPLYYAFEALMANEFHGLEFQCAPGQLIPFGPGYARNANAGCAIAGAKFGSTVVNGDEYLSTALRFGRRHLWRNFGILLAMWVIFVGMNAYAIESLPAAGSAKSILLYKRGATIEKRANDDDFEQESRESSPTIAENPTSEMQHPQDGPPSGTQTPKGGLRLPQSGTDTPRSGKGGTHTPRHGKKIEAAKAVFTWQNLDYTVGNDLQLLHGIQGYCQAGKLVALMGASGAGKTTLMDVLAQRKTEGTVKGEVRMNGKPLSVSFTRTTGYCEQVDVHLPQSTVREALEFSALLRQPRSTSREDKLAYVDQVIDLLELHDIEDAIIGIPGSGLGIEARKRTTIAVELAARPSLLFLDEPTSGLDGQSSFIIVQFLRKLVANGQTVMCTIHQPSAALFAEFDDVLLLQRGGHTSYFGAVAALPDYFGKYGAMIKKGVNPAEFMIDVVTGNLAGSKDKNWAEIWDQSDEKKELAHTIEELKKEGGDPIDEEEAKHAYAASTATQLSLVIKRASIQLWRDTEYVESKFALHVFSALFNGFSFWMIGDSYTDLQNRLFTIFQFIFVAPGVIAQVQPKFIANRDVFEAREKKAKFYSWFAFIIAEIVAEVPYLLICALLYFAPWYAVVGFSFSPGIAGPVFLQMTLYEFLYTGIGQFIAAYSPNPVFAALVNPVLISALVMFCGVLTPYDAITTFWRYWLYYLDPFNYLIGGMLVFPMWDTVVKCQPKEMAQFDPPSGQTCGAYLAKFIAAGNPGYVDNPNDMANCMYCPASRGSDYLKQRNLLKHIDGWRDILITLLFVISSYGVAIALMRLRTKSVKTAA